MLREAKYSSICVFITRVLIACVVLHFTEMSSMSSTRKAHENTDGNTNTSEAMRKKEKRRKEGDS